MKLRSIQALRAIAALLVLFAHVKGAELDYGGDGAILPYFLYMGVSGVDLFFLISGFVMVYVGAAAPAAPAAAARFAFNRAARIYPLYWIVTIALLALFAGKKLLFGEDTPITNYLESFLLLPHSAHPIVAVGWTLVHEIYFYAVFALIILAAPTRRGLLLAAWAAVVLAASVAGLWRQGPWLKVIFNPLTLEFAAGAGVAYLVRAGVTRFAGLSLVLGALIISVLYFGFAAQLYPDAFTNFGTRALLMGPPYALILYGAAALEMRGALRTPQWLVTTGDASYAIYLVHIPVFLVVGKLASLVVDDGPFDNVVLVAFFTLAALVAGFGAHFLVEKPMLGLTRKMGDRLFAAKSAPSVAPERAW